MPSPGLFLVEIAVALGVVYGCFRVCRATWRAVDRSDAPSGIRVGLKIGMAVLGAALGAVCVIAGYWPTPDLEVIGVPVPLGIYAYAKEHRDVYEFEPIAVPIAMDAGIAAALVHGVGWLMLRRRATRQAWEA